jgi:hypothetical protein
LPAALPVSVGSEWATGGYGVFNRIAGDRDKLGQLGYGVSRWNALSQHPAATAGSGGYPHVGCITQAE